MKTSINTIFSPNIGLYWKDRQFSSSRFEIVKLGKIVDLKMNFKNLYWKMQFFHKVFGKNAVKTTKNKKPKKIRHHVWRPLISKRPFERASIFIKKWRQHILYVSLNCRLQLFFRLMKTNNENAFRYKFSEILKGPSFHCQKFLDLKSLWESSNLNELISVIKMGDLFMRFFVKAVRKSSKSKKEK